MVCHFAVIKLNWGCKRLDLTMHVQLRGLPVHIGIRCVVLHRHTWTGRVRILVLVYRPKRVV